MKSLSEEREFIKEGSSAGQIIYFEKNVKEFFKKILTPNNISKGFVEVSTIKYYAGDKLTGKEEK